MSHPSSIEWESPPQEGDIFLGGNERDPEGIFRMYEFRESNWIIVGHQEADGSINKPKEGVYRYYQ